MKKPSLLLIRLSGSIDSIEHKVHSPDTEARKHGTSLHATLTFGWKNVIKTVSTLQ